jgi:hypothetical protein
MHACAAEPLHEQAARGERRISNALRGEPPAALAAEESVRGTGRVSVDVRSECNFVLALIRDRR